MIREVLKIGDPKLREIAQPVVDFGAALQELIADMRETLKLEGGIGLAATQIGVPLRVIVVCDDANPKGTMLVFVNPEIVQTVGTQVQTEGCLSVPGEHGQVRRAFRVKIKAQSHKGNERFYAVSGYEAQCIQHEIQHLSGVLFPDLPTDSNGIHNGLDAHALP